MAVAAVGCRAHTGWTAGVPADELRQRLADLRREIGPPWAEDQRIAALGAADRAG